MARALVVSLVWEDNISAMSVWKRLSRGERCSSAMVSQPIVSTGASFVFRISFTRS